MGQLHSIFSCASCSCARSNVANSDFADPPYGAVAATAPLSPGRARGRSGSVGSTSSTIPSISNTEASFYARASRRHSLAATAEIEGDVAEASKAGMGAVAATLGDNAAEASKKVFRIAGNTFSVDYLRELAAWSEAGESGSWHTRMECAALVLCMHPGDVLIQRDDGKLEFLVKALWGGGGDYVVIPIPRPADKLDFWPPLTWDRDARTALGTAYPGWGSTAANGTSLSCSSASVGGSAASTPTLDRRAELAAEADAHASARPPLPPEQAWADYSMLDAALHYSAGDLSGQHITNIARKQIRDRAYLVRSKHPRGLRVVSHCSVRLPALIAAHKAPNPQSADDMPWTAANIRTALESNRMETALANGKITRRDSLHPGNAPFPGGRANPAFLLDEDPLEEVSLPRPPSANSGSSGVDI